MGDQTTSLEGGAAIIGRNHSLLAAFAVVVAMLPPVWWAFDFRAMALASRFDPDCPPTGCFSEMGFVVAPIASILGLLVVLVLLGFLLRRRRLYEITRLMFVVIGQWFGVAFLTLGSLVD